MEKATAQQYMPADRQSESYTGIFRRFFDEFCSVWNDRFGKQYCFHNEWTEHTVREFMKCGDARHGFAHLQCPDCLASHLVPFTCKRKICLPCGEKRKHAWVEWLFKEVLFNVRHRHWVFTVPQCLRWVFKKDRKMLGVLASTAANFLKRCLQISCGQEEAMPGIVVSIQTAGDNMQFNSHVHMLATEGCLAEDNRYYTAMYIDYAKMRKLWRDIILTALVDNKAIVRNFAQKLKRRYPKGFMLNGFIKDHRGDRNLMKRMAAYIVKMPISESRILAFDEQKQKVLIKYCGVARPSKTHRERRPFKSLLELLHPLEFIARMVQHIPAPYEQTVRYYGVYGNAARGRRKKLKELGAPDIVEADFKSRRAYRKNWRRLLWKVFSVDPLLCPECGKKMVLKRIYSEKEAITSFLRDYKKRCAQVHSLDVSRPPPLLAAA